MNWNISNAVKIGGRFARLANSRKQSPPKNSKQVSKYVSNIKNISKKYSDISTMFKKYNKLNNTFKGKSLIPDKYPNKFYGTSSFINQHYSRPIQRLNKGLSLACKSIYINSNMA